MSDSPDSGRDLFRRKFAGIKRIEDDKIAPEQPKTKPRASFTRADNARVLEESLSGELDSAMEEQESFRRHEVRDAVWRKLRRGKYSIERELDLHGMKVEEARTVLADFIQECLARHLHCIRIVHGKGRGSGERGPVLKPMVTHRLRRQREVLAFSSARPVDGGTGAVYVLLRRPRR